MPPTEKHREKAEAVFKAIGDSADEGSGATVSIIAAALANAEREGAFNAFARAGEIANSQFSYGLPAGAGQVIAAAILSECREGA